MTDESAPRGASPPTDPGAASGLAALVVPAAVASLTLGLAPFVPEPHLVGKIRWVLGGATGMGAADWFDLVMHGAPWVVLVLALAARFIAPRG